MRIEGPQEQELFDAILMAFEDRDELHRMIRFGIKENPNIIASASNFQQSVFQLLEWANRESRMEDVIATLLAAKPRDDQLRQIAERIGTAAPAPLSRQEIEKVVVKTAHFADVAAWREQMSLAELAVCRIEVATAAGGTSYGTGFLVGQDLVMTNDHVVRDLIGGGVSKSAALLRFDYKKGADGTTLHPGVEYRLADDWHVASSPNSPDWQKPTLKELDYALLRVSGSPGNDPVAGQTGAPPRGWLTPQPHKFAATEPLLIIQHPQLEEGQPTEPLKFALGIVYEPDPNRDGTRVTYTTNSEPGASGSPCFTDIWELVALHHSGTTARNEGIPFRTILADLEKKGVGDLIKKRPDNGR